jgi:hypothetical protein
MLKISEWLSLVYSSVLEKVIIYYTVIYYNFDYVWFNYKFTNANSWRKFSCVIKTKTASLRNEKNIIVINLYISHTYKVFHNKLFSVQQCNMHLYMCSALNITYAIWSIKCRLQCFYLLLGVKYSLYSALLLLMQHKMIYLYCTMYLI